MATDCPHPRRTGEILERYRQTCDVCGADTTDQLEGHAAIEFLRQLRLPQSERPDA